MSTRLLGAVLILMASVMTLEGEAVERDLVFVSDNRLVISCYSVDHVSGELALLSSTVGGITPSFLAWNPKRTVLFAVDEDYVHGHVSSFHLEPGTGYLALNSTVSSGGSGPCHICVHPDGKWLFVANYGSGQVSVIPIGDYGTLGEPVEVQHPGEHAHMTLCDASGKNVFVPCLGSDHIAQYRFDEQSGHLTANPVPVVASRKGAGPRFLAACGHSFYCVNELDSTLQAYDCDAASGVLTPQQAVLSLLPPGTTGKNTGGHVLVSPSGRFVYASNRGHDSIAVFTRDPASGALSYLADEQGGGDIKTPRCFACDPSGSLLLVANQGAGSVTVFAVDAQRGSLRRLATTKVSHEPAFIGVMVSP